MLNKFPSTKSISPVAVSLPSFTSYLSGTSFSIPLKFRLKVKSPLVSSPLTPVIFPLTSCEARFAKNLFLTLLSRIAFLLVSIEFKSIYVVEFVKISATLPLWLAKLNSTVLNVAGVPVSGTFILFGIL